MLARRCVCLLLCLSCMSYETCYFVFSSQFFGSLTFLPSYTPVCFIYCPVYLSLHLPIPNLSGVDLPFLSKHTILNKTQTMNYPHMLQFPSSVSMLAQPAGVNLLNVPSSRCNGHPGSYERCIWEPGRSGKDPGPASESESDAGCRPVNPPGRAPRNVPGADWM